MLENISDQDFQNISRAIEAAVSAFNQGNYPVGAVLSIDNQVIGCSENKINENKSFIEHAEMSLILKYSTSLYDAYVNKKEVTLYSTLEPCIQCLGAAITNHVSRIIYVTKDPNGGACELQHNTIGDWYKHTWPEIIYAPVSKKSLELMIEFFKQEIRKGNTHWPEKMLRLYRVE